VTGKPLTVLARYRKGHLLVSLFHPQFAEYDFTTLYRDLPAATVPRLCAEDFVPPANPKFVRVESIRVLSLKVPFRVRHDVIRLRLINPVAELVIAYGLLSRNARLFGTRARFC
jgi:hypothetical protein